MIRKNTKKFTIVISMRHLVIASTIAVVFILGVIAFYLHRRIKSAKELRLKFYERVALKLGGEMRSEPTIMEDKDKFQRYMRAYKMLYNNDFDHDVIALDFNIENCDDKGTIIEIRYASEMKEVSQIFYTPHNHDSEDIGHVFLASGGMSIWTSGGITNLYVRLRFDPNLSVNDTPYDEWDDDRLYLVVPQMTFDRITRKEGQFVLLDEGGNVLDRFSLKELSVKEKKPLHSDVNVIQ